MAITADAVIIGAGVVGSSTALELSRRGLNVLVVDKASGAGTGSTSTSSAIIRFELPGVPTSVIGFALLALGGTDNKR